MNIIKPINFDPVKAWQLGSNAWGKPNMFVYCYLIDGLLIDTGQPRVRKELCDILEQEEIKRIIITHHHEDHSGNIEAIKKLKNIEAYASSLCCKFMLKPKRVELARWMTWGQHQPATLIPIADTLIQTNYYQFKVIPTPGHAADHISLYESNKGWLFSGDIYINDYLKMFMRDELIGHHILSLRKLLSLEFDRMFCSHQPVLKNPKKRLMNKLHFLEDFYGQVSEIYSKGYTAKEIMRSLRYKDDKLSKLLSWGQLSRTNMVKSVIKTVEQNILVD